MFSSHLAGDSKAAIAQAFLKTHSPDGEWVFFFHPDQTTRKQEDPMAEPIQRKTLSLDGWAVTLALALAALVRFGVLKHISW